MRSKYFFTVAMILPDHPSHHQFVRFFAGGWTHSVVAKVWHYDPDSDDEQFLRVKGVTITKGPPSIREAVQKKIEALKANQPVLQVGEQGAMSFPR